MAQPKYFASYDWMDQAELNQEAWEACLNNKLEQLEYVLFSPKLKIHADIYYDNGDCFFWACDKGNTNIINYLLYTVQYKFTEKLKAKCNVEIKIPPRYATVTMQEITNLFAKRDLYFQLHKLADDKPANSHKI